jgi:hypothetical protein
VQFLVPLLGLLLAGVGHAILHDWRGAADVWDRVENAFPAVMRSPAPLAGGSLLATGWLFGVLPLLA